MVHRLIVFYGKPEDPAAFDAHYRDVHVGLAQGIPGVVSFTIGHPESLDGSPPPYHLVAQLDFESAEAMNAALTDPKGGAAAADVANFATGGATMAHYEVEDVTPR
jgi:uncharacterized protein (TIGR02118 family)